MRTICNLAWIIALLYVAYCYSPDMRDISANWAQQVTQALEVQ